MAEVTPIHDNARPKGDIFVAFAREDERAVERLRTGLARYIDVTWHSHLKFPELAAERPQGIADAVRDCDIFLSVFSRATAARGEDYSWLELIWVEMWKKISPAGKHYLAVLIDDAPESARRESHSFPDAKYIRLPEGEVSPEFGAQLRALLTGDKVSDKDRPVPVLSIPVVEPKAPEKPLIHDENVQFTVYRPKTIVPQRWHTMLAFAHLSEKAPDASPEDPDPMEEVARQARQILGQADDYGRTTQDSSQAVPRDGEITMVPLVQGITFNPPQRTFLWTEAVHREEFRLRAASPALEPKTVLRGRLTIYLGTLIIAEIPLKFQAELEASPVPAQNMATTQARPYRKIFASYSHQDMAIVEHIEHYANAVGDTYLRDALNLRSGQEWDPELLRMIDQADIFQLFWSSNSMRSPYCRREWEHALGLNRPSFIRPTYWEDPLPSLPHQSLPPPELSRLHFQRIMSNRLPVAQPKSEVRGIGSSSSSIEEKLSRVIPVAATARPLTPDDSEGMVPPPSASAPPRSSGGGRRGIKKIALIACVAVVAIGGFCFQYGRQNIMTAAVPSPLEAQKEMEQQVLDAKAQMTAPAEQTATAQISTDTNSQNAPAAASFDASPPPLTADAATAPNLTLTNAPQVTQDQAPQPGDEPVQPTATGTQPIAVPALPPPPVSPPAAPPPQQ